MLINTSDDIKTMSNVRTTWSIRKSLSGCNKTKDEIRLKRNESRLKRRRLKRENMELLRKISEIERRL